MPNIECVELTESRHPLIAKSEIPYSLRIVPLQQVLNSKYQREPLIQAYVTGFNSAQVTEKLWKNLPKTYDEVAAWLDRTAASPNSPYYCIKPAWYLRPIGHIGIRLANDSDIATSSLVIFNTDYWGMGVATHALRLMLQTVRLPEHIKHLRAHILEDHSASRSVAEHNGFINTGRTDVEGGNDGLIYMRDTPEHLVIDSIYPGLGLYADVPLLVPAEMMWQ